MTHAAVSALIRETGIIPAIRVDSASDALFAAGAIFEGGIPVVELTMTVPGALGVLAELRKEHPDLLIGAGTILDVDTARSCIDAGADFLTSPGLVPTVIALATDAEIAVIPGALTPTEVMVAIQAGAAFVKIFPCAQVGGPGYIKALKGPFPNAPLIASGGINQATAMDYLNAGADVLGIGKEVIPRRAIEGRNAEWINELAGRFLEIVRRSRAR